jgi:TorA maturation chaperone TorD
MPPTGTMDSYTQPTINPQNDAAAFPFHSVYNKDVLKEVGKSQIAKIMKSLLSINH